MKAVNIESDRHEGSTFEYPVHVPFNHPHPFDPTTPLLALHQHQPSRHHQYPPAYTHLPPSAASPLDPHASSHSFPPPHPRPLQTQPLPQAPAYPVDMPYSRHPSTPPQPASAVESQLRRVPFSGGMADRRHSLDTPRISHLPEDHYHPHTAMAPDYPHPSELDRPFDPSLQYASSTLASQTNAQRRKAVRATQVRRPLELTGQLLLNRVPRLVTAVVKRRQSVMRLGRNVAAASCKTFHAYTVTCRPQSKRRYSLNLPHSLTAASGKRRQ